MRTLKRRAVEFALVACWAASGASAENNFIRQWNANIPSAKYQIDQDQRTVTIKQGSTDIFKFEAFDLDTPWPHSPGDIDLITTDGNIGGQVLLMVVGDPGQARTYGARDLKGINLRYSTSSSQLRGVHISGDLGSLYWIDVLGILSYVTADGDLYHGISALTGSGSISFGGSTRATIHFSSSMSGTITVGQSLLGNITGDTSLGNITVSGTGPHTGNITVQQNYSAIAALNGTYSGAMSFNGNLSGPVTIQNGLSGSITVVGAASNVISVGGDVSGFIKLNDSLSGQIRVDGALRNGSQANDIWVGTSLGTTGAVVIDYDGWDPNDIWASGAIVRVGDNTYSENTRDARVYRVTMCRGDMNNDGTVFFDDINPYVLALNDPAGYASAFPGLAGSRVYHGDINCDGTFDFGDINPFVALLGHPCCHATYEPCPGDDEDESPSPELLAATLAAYVSPGLYDSLVTLVGEGLAWQVDEDQRAYWEAVYGALTQ